jgi:hypothetical protein
VEGTRHSTRIPQSLRVSPGALVRLGAIAQEPITSESTHLTPPVRGGTLQGQTLFFLAIHQGRSALGQIGEPIRRYTVIPLEEPVLPTPEPVTSPPPSKSPEKAPPVTEPEPEPVR